MNKIIIKKKKSRKETSILKISKNKCLKMYFQWFEVCSYYDLEGNDKTKPCFSAKLKQQSKAHQVKRVPIITK